MTFGLDERLIQSIQGIGQNYAIERIVLFGSRARGDHKPTQEILTSIEEIRKNMANYCTKEWFKGLNFFCTIEKGT